MNKIRNKILIVDDDPGIWMLYSDALLEEGLFKEIKRRQAK